jgi:cytochrome c peroxidase
MTAEALPETHVAPDRVARTARRTGAWLATAALALAGAAVLAEPNANPPMQPPAPAVAGGPAGGSLVAPRMYGTRPSVAELTAIGRAIFNDPSLSVDGRMACATCHDPRAAFGPGPAAPSPFTDGDPAHRGVRAIPQLRYAQFMPRFTEHFIDDDDGHGVDAGPTGGLTWDGRADTAREQARIPLFAPNEMGNVDDAGLARRVARASYAEAFRRAFSAPGRNVFDDPKRLVDWLALALEVYQQAPEFAPFSSKWDRVLAGKEDLTPAELRGLKLYENPNKANCEKCHPSSRITSGAAPLFTDGGLVAAAVPRRAGLPPPAASAAVAPASAWTPAAAASNPDYDLGLCGSGRLGLSDDPGFCGRFKTPSLRNVAIRPSFFHNGALRTLREVLEFYATRDTDPGRWYPRNADGSVRIYDDLPEDLKQYVDHEVPFIPLPGNRPRLNDKEIDDLLAFLQTLTDADVAGAPAPKIAAGR